MTLAMTLKAISIHDFSQYEIVFVLIIKLVGKRLLHFKYGVENKDHTICFRVIYYLRLHIYIEYLKC